VLPWKIENGAPADGSWLVVLRGGRSATWLESDETLTDVSLGPRTPADVR
jgi:hypothetical protein